MIDAFDIFTAVWIFVFGVVFGSFLNVCIWRFPREESIVKPGSHCPKCEKPITWRDNIPLISFILLRGKCRHCSERISIRYPLIEIANGALWVFLWHTYGLSGMFFAGIIYFSILLAVIMTDFETGYIPDLFTFPGMALGLIFSALVPVIHEEGIWYRGLLDSAIGLLAGGGILVLIAIIGNFIFRKESMGGGDVKLMAMMGAYIGAKQIFLVFLFAPILALPVAFYMRVFKKAETLPYGPYLAVTGAYFYLYGESTARNFFSF